MKSLPPITQGDSFSFHFALNDDAGDPAPFATVVATICDPTCESVVQELDWTPDGTNPYEGDFTAAADETTEWPVSGSDTAGPLTIHVRVTYIDGTAESVEPLALTVLAGIPGAPDA